MIAPPLFAAFAALTLAFALFKTALAQAAAAEATPVEEHRRTRTPRQVNGGPGAQAARLDCSMVKCLVVGQNQRVLD